MPLSPTVHALLDEIAKESGDYTLLGIFINPESGEMGTYCSHGFEPGAILGILQNVVTEMVTAAINGNLQMPGEPYGIEAQGKTPEGATDGKAYLIH